MPSPVRYSFVRIFGEFCLLVAALTCWFLAQHVAFRPPPVQPGEAWLILNRAFDASLLYSVVIYLMFYLCCRRRQRADVFFNISLGVALLGVLLCVAQILITPAVKGGDPGYTSLLHLPMNLNSLRWLGFATDPLLLLPAFAFFYLERHRPQR